MTTESPGSGQQAGVPAVPGPPVAAACDPDETAALRRSCRILANIVARNHQAMEAARIEMLLNGPHAGMQWVLNSLPDVWDDDETAWDGKESAQAWFDRTESFYRAAREDAEASAVPSPSPVSPEPVTVDVAAPGDGWRGRVAAALDASIDRCARCKVCDNQIDAVMTAILPLAELEDAITWNTSCLSCSRVLDSAYAETARREAAEAKLAEIRELCEEAGTRTGGRILAITGTEEGQ